MSEAILFVDDEVNVLDGLKRQFHGKYKVEVATSGRDALTIVRERGPFAVVIADMKMPGMSGIDLMMTLYNDAPHTARIILTGFADRPAAIEAVKKGHVFHFLSKPCSEEALTMAIQAGIDLYRLQQKIVQIQDFVRTIE
jgi:DNA-binding NtrC family response regulator